MLLYATTHNNKLMVESRYWVEHEAASQYTFIYICVCGRAGVRNDNGHSL